MGHSFSRLFSRYLAKKEMVRILMKGLKEAGKTTILNNMKLGEIVTSAIPTTPDIIIDIEAGGGPQPQAGCNVEIVESRDISITVWDVEEKWQINPFLQQYFQNTRGLIFVVDSNNRDCLVEARDELHHMLNEDKFRDVALLVYANKQDLPNAMNAAELIKELDLHSLAQHHWYIQNTCATTGEGLYNGLDWLFNEIDNMDTWHSEQ